MAAPMMGATQNSQSWLIGVEALSPKMAATTAWEVERAGLTLAYDPKQGRIALIGVILAALIFAWVGVRWQEEG